MAAANYLMQALQQLYGNSPFAVGPSNDRMGRMQPDVYAGLPQFTGRSVPVNSGGFMGQPSPYSFPAYNQGKPELLGPTPYDPNAKVDPTAPAYAPPNRSGGWNNQMQYVGPGGGGFTTSQPNQAAAAQQFYQNLLQRMGATARY
jgi:hypothetical protein